MKDIFEILKYNGIEVEENKHKDIRRALNEHYIAANEHTKKIESLNDQLKTANDTITDLNTKLEDASKVDVKALQDRIKEFEDAEETRKQNEAAAKETEALKTRFSSLKGDKEFHNDYTENGAFEEFRVALSLDENKGKSDADIFTAVSENKNWFKSPNKIITQPTGNIGGGSDQRTATLMKAMGLKSKGD